MPIQVAVSVTTFIVAAKGDGASTMFCEQVPAPPETVLKRFNWAEVVDERSDANVENATGPVVVSVSWAQVSSLIFSIWLCRICPARVVYRALSITRIPYSKVVIEPTIARVITN